jgi:hypothetical protein
MIQLQILIDVPESTGHAQININRLAREDVNDNESKFADVFEGHFKELLDAVVREFSKRDIPADYTEIDKEGKHSPRQPSEQGWRLYTDTPGTDIERCLMYQDGSMFWGG